LDFDDTPDEAALRRRARTFVAAHAPDTDEFVGDWPPRAVDDERDRRFVEAARLWQRRKYDHDLAGLSWPSAFGGQGMSGICEGIFAEEEGEKALLSGVFAVGIGMVGPTIIEHGSDTQRARFLEPMLRGEQVWCQLFSEPEAGSDLASLRTKAVRDGDRWVVRGQKVWTSHAHYADWGILLARTDDSVPRHRGITCFLLDMTTPGIVTRPLRQATGSAEFNEVFLDDVAIPVDNVLGPVDDGWRVAMTTLTSERASIGGNLRIFTAEDTIELARRHGRTSDPVVRQRLAEAHIRAQIMTWIGYRARTAVTHGRTPGPETSVMKLAMSRHLAASGDLVLELMGPGGLLDLDDAEDDGLWQGHFLYQWASRIGGGTDEVQRNVIGERVLGLPKEPRVA
jgi:alkylation response protein AidB-like acyl-CoA dehydrogenase